MKRIVYLAILMILTNLGLQAQITIGMDQIPVIGDSVVYQNAATPAGIDLGSAAPNQVWDFSGLSSAFTNTDYYVDPNIDSTSANFPTATLAIQDGLGITTQYAEVTNDEVLGLGFVSDDFLGFAITVVLDPEQTIFEIPTNYEDSYIDQSEAVIGLSEPQPMVDTARVVFSSTDTVNMDAYGILKLPNGDFEVLRREQKNQTIISFEIFLGFFWVPVFQDTTNATTYTFLAREAKRELAVVTLDSTNTQIANIQWQDIDPLPITPPTAVFACVDTAATPGLVHFEDQSQNTPTEWLWDFGDGNTSTEQNPEHIYSDDLMVEVCLTVSNSGGSDQTCKTINVNVGTRAPNWNSDWGIGPNPSNGLLTLNLKEDYAPGMELLFYNQVGKLVEQFDFQNNRTYTIDHLPNGQYLLTIRNNQNIIGTTKIQLLK